MRTIHNLGSMKLICCVNFRGSFPLRLIRRRLSHAARNFEVRKKIRCKQMANVFFTREIRRVHTALTLYSSCIMIRNERKYLWYLVERHPYIASRTITNVDIKSTLWPPIECLQKLKTLIPISWKSRCASQGRTIRICFSFSRYRWLVADYCKCNMFREHIHIFAMLSQQVRDALKAMLKVTNTTLWYIRM